MVGLFSLYIRPLLTTRTLIFENLRKALDMRSRARLGQEYVAMLKVLVAKDKKVRVQDKTLVN